MEEGLDAAEARRLSSSEGGGEQVVLWKDKDAMATELSIVINETPITVRRKTAKGEESDDVDCFFFDESYSVEASTGFDVWEASWAFINVLGEKKGTIWDLVHGAKLIELGAGTGLLGLALAAAGSHVIVTDLESVLEGILDENINRNVENFTSNIENKTDLPLSQGWNNAKQFGGGTIRADAVDWTIPLHKQPTMHNDLRECDVVVAADTVWLKDLVKPFVQTVVSLLEPQDAQEDLTQPTQDKSATTKPPRTCLLAFHERSTQDSHVFASTEDLLDEFRERNCKVDVVHRVPALQNPDKFVYFYEILLRK